METSEQPEGEDVTEEAYVHSLGFDWTEGVPINDEIVEWALALDIPANVTGVDYSRAISREPAGGEGVA